MAGPIIEAIKETVEENRDIEFNRPIKEHKEELQKKMKQSGGGCCNAMMAAEAIRKETQDYK